MYGFVYIWHDRRDGRFYIGSHCGAEDDGYVCSSNGKGGMKAEYRTRPNDFRRRILCRVYTNRADLLAEEQRWLDLIPRHEFGWRYYNLSVSVRGTLILSEAAQREASRKAGLSNRGRKFPPRSEEWCRNIAAGRKGKGFGRVFSVATREKIRIANTGKKHSETTKAKIAINSTRQFSTVEARQRHAERLTGRKLSTEHCANISRGLKGITSLGWSAGKVWITNGVRDIQVSKDATIPSGFSRGRRTVPPTFGKIWITDGQRETLLPKGIPLPQGFVAGRVKNYFLVEADE